MRYFIASTWMFVLLLIPGMASAASPAASRPVEMDMLLNLLRDKGLITAEESAAFERRSSGGTASRSDIKAIIDLLRSKGSISDQEAVNFLQKLTAKPLKEEQTAAPSPEKSEPEIAPATPPFDEDMVRAALNVILVKQGVLGADEAAQIGERIGRKWTKAEENDIIADPDTEIEYHRTTLPKEGLLADVDQLVSQGLLAKDEAERVKARFLRKFSLERVTDDIGANLRQDLHSQVEQKIVPIPEWVRHIKLGGDMRLRYEGDFFGDRNADFLNPSNTTTLFNSQIDRERIRIRARLNGHRLGDRQHHRTGINQRYSWH
jgi:polyhydroxyalkanoate synthesis regulator phasin